MEAEELKQAWGSQFAQGRVTIDAELLLKEVQRSQRLFTAMLFWRDAREVGIAAVLIPVWIYLGIKTAVPWTWYLTVPILIWVAGFMVAHRLRHRQISPEVGEPLRVRIANALLTQVEGQIWLLRNVHWWALLPFLCTATAFFAHTIFGEGGILWLNALVFAGMVGVVSIVLGAVYWLNRHAIRTELEPRRAELMALMAGLGDESLGGS